MVNSHGETVVLIPGLWSKYLLFQLNKRFLKQGYNVIRFLYNSTRNTPTQNSQALLNLLTQINAPKIHLVAHSLGGLILLNTLHSHSIPNLGNIVLLGSPVHGSQAAKSLLRYRWGKFFLGKSAEILAHGCDIQVPGNPPIGAIHGTKSFLGLGYLVTRLPKPNDGIVTLPESSYSYATDNIILPVTHLGLIFVEKVWKQAEYFLRNGRFNSA